MNNALTPSSINEQNFFFTIPVYQRLFVWEEEQIIKLLEDLHNSYTKNKIQPYYIGIITVSKNAGNAENTENGQFEVIDGQQRLTFLMLIGAALKRDFPEWGNFLHNKGDLSLRLSYTARENDKLSLEKLIADFDNYNEISNKRMALFCECFKKFENAHSDNMAGFAEYVYNKCSLLLSVLPDTYKEEEMNLYFEKMNATGRQLEAHEILKVKLISKITNNVHDCYDKWNKISDFTTKYISPSKGNNTEYDNAEKIIDISESSSSLYGKETNEFIEVKDSVHGLLKFPVFLLHVLAIQEGRIDDARLNPQKLLETFKSLLEGENSEADTFISEMEKYREWLDKNIIYIRNNNAEWRKDEKNEKDTSEEKDDDFKQLQLMLYVSSPDSQRWILNAYSESRNGELKCESLKKIDDELHPLSGLIGNEKNGMNKYPQIERYWFWKLDYILWTMRKSLYEKYPLTKEFETAVNNFSFKANRSIEHLHAQHREDPNKNIFSVKLDSFGNLAMISGGSNSRLSNGTVAVKFASVKDSMKNNLESIKLLLMFAIANGEDAKWTEDVAQEHEDKMIVYLKEYYAPTENI